VQPTPEVLFYRTDLFGEAGLCQPATTEDVLFAARTLHRSARDLSGIVMNFGRGIPVTHTFVQTLADFGQPVIDLAPLGADFDTDTIEDAHFRPMIDTEAGHACAKFLRELLDYSHRDSLKCNWDPQIAIFAAGQAAMYYVWTIRAAAFELDDTAHAHGRFDCVAHPPGTGARAVSPIGGFSLALPAGLDAPGTARAWKVMEYLTRPEMMKWYVQNGNLTSPRFSTSADPEVQAMTRVISRVDAMEKRGELQIWPRPPVAEFQGILDVLGVEIHRMLTGDATIPEALAAAQNRVDGLMRAAGRY
jgi:multiple sugar transport system substrate-binding protein